MERTKWTERIFTFDLPEGWLYNILERLEGTAIRIKEMTSGIPDDECRLKSNGKWSIKEQIGHLSDLEELHEGRVDDFLAQQPVLRAANMANPKTEAANHNDKTMEELLTEFLINRKRFIARLRNLDDATHQVIALHPRLKAMMRPVDMAYFVAEHDDHHLATIRELVNQKAIANGH